VFAVTDLQDSIDHTHLSSVLCCPFRGQSLTLVSIQ
jgi:hypothetical protein